MLKIGEVVQFNESHKWRGTFGIVDEIKGVTVVVAIPIPQGDEVHTAFIRCYDYQLEKIGNAVLINAE